MRATASAGRRNLRLTVTRVERLFGVGKVRGRRPHEDLRGRARRQPEDPAAESRLTQALVSELQLRQKQAAERPAFNTTYSST